MAGLPGAVHYAFASSLCRTQKVLSGLGTQNTLRPPTPLIRGWGLPAANRLETQGWGRYHGGARLSTVGGGVGAGQSAVD